MLADDGIVLAKLHLFRGLAGILLGRVEETSAGTAKKFDQDGGWLGHDEDPAKYKNRGADNSQRAAGVKSKLAN
jgi:hypothetical protein